MKDKNEMLYAIPLRDAYEKKRKKRAPSAVKIIKEFISRHMGSALKSIKLSSKLNYSLWFRGIEKPPRKVRIKAVKEKESGNVYVMLVEEKLESFLKKETPKEKKEDKKELAKKEAKESKESKQKKTEKPEKKEEIKKEKASEKSIEEKE